VRRWSCGDLLPLGGGGGFPHAQMRSGDEAAEGE
jgi:hypothetical protein